jgi:glyoxylase-like metal-dependent hydrolase (beta-lactamase superfamily II)
VLAIPLRTPTLPPATHTTCYLLGHEQAILVDPGSPYPGELARLRPTLHRLLGSGGGLAAILLTHHHRDHAGGALELARELRIPVAAHAETLSRVPLPGVERLALDEGARLELAPGLALEVLHTPGHAPGHLCLFEPGERVLLGGDMVPGIGTTLVEPPEGELAAYLASLERLRALDPALILPAHGPPIEEGAAAIGRLIEHRRWREQRVADALRVEPRDPLAIAREAYAELAPWQAGLALRSTLAHLAKLAHEGRAIRDGERWRRGGR